MSGDDKDNQERESISNCSATTAKMDFIQPASIIDFVPDATLAIDLKGKVIAWNKAMENLTGMKAIDILGKGDYVYALPFYNCRRPILVDLVLKPDAKIESEYRNLQRDGTSISGEAQISSFRQGGSYTWGKAAPLYDSSGKIIGAIESIRDITELKQIEEDLRRSREKYHNIFENSIMGIYQSVQGGRYINVNPAFARLFGYDTPEELIASVTDIGHQFYVNPQDRDRAIKTLLEQGFLEGFELEVRRRDGTKFWVSMNTLIVQDEDGTHYDGTVEDINKRKKAEDELRKAKETAESAAKAKSDFLANMSHEIRTPMNAVIGLADLLMETDLTADQRNYLKIIGSSGDSLLSVINDILDFSKVDSGMMELESRPFELKRCVEDSLNLVRAIASKKSLDLTYAIDETTPRAIIGDSTRLQQILANLLSNAVKFTDKGAISISVSSEKLDGVCHGIYFEMKDTGIGIPEDKMSRLFQPFTQVDSSTTRSYGGTGLGLAISKKLVEMMGGRIWAESELGKGSTFHFTILADATLIKPSSSMISETRKDRDIGIDKNQFLRILLAEDNVVNQMVMLKMLNNLGYHADVASNGKEVLRSLEIQPYDLILMDVQMPEMDGFEAARAIRKRWASADQPKIIAITAYALKGDREKCLDAGMDDYLSKPVTLEDLRAVLEPFGI
ncbi:MAG: ATP-binding protein [Methanothrix sp.]|nr:ATP-binding protein [Methanothrix sp.]